MDSADYSSYKPCLTLALPITGTVPATFNIDGINYGQVAGLLTNLNAAIVGTIDYIVEEASWANETSKSLEKLSAFFTPLLDALSPITLSPLQITENTVERYMKYNRYFHIVEYKDMDLLQLLKEDTKQLSSILVEMQIIRMDEQEIINFLKGAAVRFETYQQIIAVDAKKVPGPEFSPSVHDPLIFDCRISSAFYRWYACHWDFALNLLHARFQLDAAAEFYDGGDNEATAKSIVKAGTLLRASSSDMVFGCNMPAKIYQNYIRPSMGEGFTGNDNAPWAIFATAKKELLSKAGIQTNQIINRAWSTFFEKYIEDIEIHTTIADKLVGEKPSLVIDELNQDMPDDEKDNTPATSMLRNLHYKRLSEFAFLHSYPILYTLFKPKVQ